MAGGQSWTEKWLKFDNSYFSTPEGPDNAELLRLETDACLSKDPSFKPFFDKYADSQDDFFADCERDSRGEKGANGKGVQRGGTVPGHYMRCT